MREAPGRKSLLKEEQEALYNSIQHNKRYPRRTEKKKKEPRQNGLFAVQ